MAASKESKAPRKAVRSTTTSGYRSPGAAATVPGSPPGHRSSVARTATLTLPFVTATFRVPELRLPELRLPEVRMPEVRMPEAIDPRRLAGKAGHVAASVRSALPPRSRLIYYTGLGVLAAAEIVEWPVALAIGAGTVIAQRAGGHEHADR